MVGKTAPEPPAGTVDFDGKAAKLGDYRGKVVVLDFWLINCPPCRKLTPHNRDLVRKYAGRPFAFIGVSGDADRGEAERFLRQQNQPWVQWWGGPDGGMPRAWNLTAFPSVVVLDARGVIRAKFRGGAFEPKDIEAAVDKLVRAAEGPATK